MPYLGLIFVIVLIVAIVDIASAEEHQIRGLPRVLWIFIVLLVPLAGSIAWLVAGRPITATPRRNPLEERGFPEYDKPGRFIPEDAAADAEFLRQCRERAETQRRASAKARRQREEGDAEGNASDGD
jgi:hypothetical protein